MTRKMHAVSVPLVSVARPGSPLTMGHYDEVLGRAEPAS